MHLRHYPPKFGMHVAALIPELKDGMANFQPADCVSSAKEVFASTEFMDLWQESRMVEVLQYLKGNTALRIPEDWRPLLPTSL